jgi:valacyclovir hydrolase
MPYFTHNSHQLFYREQGSGPLLLILPGNTASSACHQEELEYFSRHYHAASLDFWGTGQSDRLDVWPDDWWYQGARDAVALTDHLGQKHVLAMGTSGGAIVALLLAIHFPDRVQGVVADSCVELYPPKALRTVVAERLQRTPRQVQFWRFAHGEQWQQVVDADSALLMRLAERGVVDWSHSRLEEIRCPVLLTASLCDQSLPDVGRQACTMAEKIPTSRLLLVNKGDHPLMWSQREDFLHLSEYFLKRALKPETAHRV